MLNRRELTMTDNDTKAVTETDFFAISGMLCGRLEPLRAVGFVVTADVLYTDEKYGREAYCVFLKVKHPDHWATVEDYFNDKLKAVQVTPKQVLNEFLGDFEDECRERYDSYRL
jgi:hypothetical protein